LKQSVTSSFNSTLFWILGEIETAISRISFELVISQF